MLEKVGLFPFGVGGTGIWDVKEEVASLLDV